MSVGVSLNPVTQTLSPLRDWSLCSAVGGACGATWSLLGVSVPVSLIHPPVESLRNTLEEVGAKNIGTQLLRKI
ncbi:hypothetical protein VZT92_027885 [Zoarces viviparus]|uniref:Uncharacterized protein n=1 Tax=Zoarces viviparus TaxID=48416 RepID=A0AAW1DW50_ZOAVI